MSLVKVMVMFGAAQQFVGFIPGLASPSAPLSWYTSAWCSSNVHDRWHSLTCCVGPYRQGQAFPNCHQPVVMFNVTVAKLASRASSSCKCWNVKSNGISKYSQFSTSKVTKVTCRWLITNQTTHSLHYFTAEGTFKMDVDFINYWVIVFWEWYSRWYSQIVSQCETL